MRKRGDINRRSNANRLLFACLEDLVIALKVRVSKMPEGRFKEFLMTTYFRFYHNPLYGLNSIVSRAQLLQDGSLFVQLGDGTEFYGLQDRRSVPQIKHGDRRKLGKIKDFLLFGSFFCVLANQYVERGYDRYHSFTKGE
jgi:hypothetical protein